MNISQVTIEQILLERERRVEKQRRLIKEYKLPLVCFTMNIAGEVKNSPLIEFAFMCGVHMLDKMPFEIKYRELCLKDEGCTAYYVVNADAKSIKDMTTEFENSCEAARLFDMDVLNENFVKLSRNQERKCLLCSEKAAVCARSRTHGLEKIKQKTDELLMAFAAEKLSEYACDALLKEVFTTPKPGLVDEENSGAHRDMNINTFIKSTEALKPYFYDFALCGMNEYEKSAEQIADKLKKIGIDAEKTMFCATSNVNTHKGSIYSLGLIIANIGICLKAGKSKLSEIAAVLMEDAFEKAKVNPQTHGEMLYRKKGVKGIRAEAFNGFPNAKCAAEVLKEYKKRFSENEARVFTLVEIMRTLEDTNVLYRGGEEALFFMHESAEKIALYNEDDRIKALKLLDVEFINRNISPGGCADTLALAVFLDLLSEKHYYLLKSIF